MSYPINNIKRGLIRVPHGESPLQGLELERKKHPPPILKDKRVGRQGGVFVF